MANLSSCGVLFFDINITLVEIKIIDNPGRFDIIHVSPRKVPCRVPSRRGPFYLFPILDFSWFINAMCFFANFFKSAEYLC